MNSIREILQINEQELQRGLAGTPASWHEQYAQSAWIYVGNLDHALTEGDVICVLSQYGEIEDLHLVREEDTGKSRGFAFCKYEDARSCVLAVDNFCGVQLCGRSLRVDHVENYRLPKHLAEKEEHDAAEEANTTAGHAYRGQELASQFSLQMGQDLFAPPPAGDTVASNENADNDTRKGKRKREEEKRQKRAEKEKRKREREEKRMEREERRRERRARKMKDDDDTKTDDHRRKRKSDVRSERRRFESDGENSGDKIKKRNKRERSHRHNPSKQRDRSDDRNSDDKPARHHAED